MRIFEFDAKERLDDIKQNFQQVLEIRNSLADNREKYRRLSDDMSISQDSLFKCCDTFERSLLINCYTFSEQLMKNFVYELIEKDKHENNFLNKFIDNKIPKNRFSPNVMLEKMEGDIKKELSKDFKFILPRSADEVKIYNEMVNSRHTYAHGGIYNFDFNNFGATIQVLEYIYFEFSTIIKYGESFRFQFQKDLKEIRELSEKISKITDIKYQRDKLREIKLLCKKILRNYSDIIDNVALLNNLNNKIKNVSEMDLRNQEKSQDEVKALFLTM